MKLLLKRTTRTNKSTIGELFIDGKFECYTLEDVEREVKVYGKTAIPKGTYKVIINPSNRFKRLLPLLLKVPNFEGVRIHPGNTAENTEGCILLGQTKSVDFIGKSKLAFDKFFDKLHKAKECTITIQ